jgi:signal transduction histidine kinase
MVQRATKNSHAKSAQKKRPLIGGRLSYVTQVSLAFSLVAAGTALAAILVVAFVWGQYFQTYTAENIDSVASNVARHLASTYKKNGELNADNVMSSVQAVLTSSDMGFRVVNERGETVYDSSAQLLSLSQSGDTSIDLSLALSEPSNFARSTITVDGQNVGTVYVWFYGADSLMSQLDRQFRDNSFQALTMAGIASVMIATLLGLLFANRLVAPISRLTRTAIEVKTGNYEARANLDGEDEISRLGQTFDEMVSQVEKDRQLEKRLTSDVAHELRTPLMSIQTNVEAMIDGVYEADAEHLELIDSEVQRLSRMVDALLRLSRLENKAHHMEPERLNVSALVDDLLHTHELFVEESGLTLTYNIEPDLYVMGDSDMLRQAIVNLLSNAVRYTQEGGAVGVSVQKNNYRKSVEIAVHDNGIGLSEEEAEMVFSRFWRADDARNRESGGLGIGLSMVKEIVNAHHGEISVTGKKGEGATFAILLPLAKEHHDKPAKTGKAARDQKGSRGVRASNRKAKSAMAAKTDGAPAGKNGNNNVSSKRNTANMVETKSRLAAITGVLPKIREKRDNSERK